MKKVIVFATDDFGGAGKAALRVVKALQGIGRECKMLVKNKTINDNDIIKINAINAFGIDKRIENFISRKKAKDIQLDDKYYFGYKYDDIKYSDILSYIDYVPDTIIVTWITWFISPNTIRELASYCNAKIVLYPMDMSLFTGGCHYAWQCAGYKNKCQNCPAIKSSEHKYIAENRLSEKKKSWTGSDVEFWSCSSGVSFELANSSLASAQIIKKSFIPIDENVYNAKNRAIAKNIFNIASDSKVILFGSNFSYEFRKGIEYFIESMNMLHSSLPIALSANIKIIVAGRKEKGRSKEMPFDVIDIDFIKDELLLSHLYQAADVLVCPSIQDSGPMMINEAQMCGLPVVAFGIGVATDFIVDGVSGYLCDLGNAEQMSIGIEKIVLGEPRIDNQKIAYMAYQKTSFKAFDSFVNSLK